MESLENPEVSNRTIYIVESNTFLTALSLLTISFIYLSRLLHLLRLSDSAEKIRTLSQYSGLLMLVSIFLRKIDSRDQFEKLFRYKVKVLDGNRSYLIQIVESFFSPKQKRIFSQEMQDMKEEMENAGYIRSKLIMVGYILGLSKSICFWIFDGTKKIASRLK